MTPLISIDIGNSSPSVMTFSSGKNFIKSSLDDFIKNWTEEGQTPILLSQVAKREDLPTELLKKRINPLAYLKDHFFFDMPVDYAPSLGVDRLVQAFYIYHQTNKMPSLLIDSGTFTKIDCIGPEGFRGGHIFPGVSTFLKSYQQGDFLPPIGLKELYRDLDLDFNLNLQEKQLPRDTKAAITQSCHLYYRSIIGYLLKSFPVKKIFLSGGDHLYIQRLLPNELQKSEIIEDLIHHAHFFIYHHFIAPKHLSSTPTTERAHATL